MKGYKHLTAHDRNKMAKMRKEGATMRQIGAALHVSAATVCRELKRGTYTYLNADYIEVTEYIPERSQKRYEANLEAKGPGLKIGNHRDYAEKLEELIVDYDYSPSAALHEIENHPEIYGEFGVRVCRQTLYSYVEKRIFARLTNKDLPFKGSRKGGQHREKAGGGQHAPRAWPLGNGSGGVLPRRSQVPYGPNRAGDPSGDHAPNPGQERRQRGAGHEYAGAEIWKNVPGGIQDHYRGQWHGVFRL